MVWSDRTSGLETTICPVLTFTPEVESAFRWFYATHELVNADGRFWWSRTGLPGAGSVGDQESRLLEVIEYLAQVQNSLANKSS